MLIIGDPPNELSAEQNGLATVLVSWRDPPAPPSGGYRITVDSTSISITTSAQQSEIPVEEPGVYSVRVKSLSQHYPGRQAGPVEVTVKGKETLTRRIAVP